MHLVPVSQWHLTIFIDLKALGRHVRCCGIFKIEESRDRKAQNNIVDRYDSFIQSNSNPIKSLDFLFSSSVLYFQECKLKSRHTSYIYLNE